MTQVPENMHVFNIIKGPESFFFSFSTEVLTETTFDAHHKYIMFSFHQISWYIIGIIIS